MADITCARVEDTDLLMFQGGLDDATLEELNRTISRLRRQGSRKILLRGDHVSHIQTGRLERLARPIRVYRGTGGVIALAGFTESSLDAIRRASWYRYLNVFRTGEEAWQFLNPHTPQPEFISPVGTSTPAPS